MNSQASRDNDLVFVGMPIGGNPRWETQEAFKMFENGNKIGRFSFIPIKINGAGLPVTRNIITHLALKSKARWMLQVDGDNMWGPVHFERISSHGEPFVGGMYPKKSLEFGWVGNFMHNPVLVREDGLAPAYDVGAGFSFCDLTAVEKMCHPELQFATEIQVEVEGHPELSMARGEIVHDLWSTGPVVTEFHGRQVTRYLSEDFYFFHRARLAGFPVFMDTQCQIGHLGTVDFLKLWILEQAHEREKQQLRACVASLTASLEAQGRRE